MYASTNFSWGYVSCEYLQDMTQHVDLNPPIMQQSQHITDKTVLTSNHYVQQHNLTPPPPPQQRGYHNSTPVMMRVQDSSACTPVQANYQTQMQVCCLHYFQRLVHFLILLFCALNKVAIISPLNYVVFRYMRVWNS